MSIKVEWTSLGISPDTLTLYWADAPFTMATLPTNKVVITNTASDYTDTTVSVNSIRYYMLEAVKAGNNTQYSQCMLYGNYPKTGPGASAPKMGDWLNGYFGIVPAANMISISALRTAVGSPTIGSVPADTTLVGYHKYIVDGKIVFIPTHPFSNRDTLWPQIYNAGLVYGINGNGTAPFALVNTGFAPPIPALVNQMKTVAIGTDTFIVRLPKASTVTTDTYALANLSSAGGSEWWKTICNTSYPLVNTSVPRNTEYYWGDLVSSHIYAATQHFSTVNNQAAITGGSNDGYIARTITSTGQVMNWFPVLELIF